MSFSLHAEGGAHILVREEGEYHTLLRIPKYNGGNPNEVSYASSLSAAIANKYCARVEAFQLDVENIETIFSNIESTRCDIRRKSGHLVPRACTALRIEDLTRFSTSSHMLIAGYRAPDGTVDDNVLTFEIKVKGGLLSQSPFIPADDADRSIKRRVGRFRLMQLYKLSTSSTESSSSTCVSGARDLLLSNYDPRDLCSRDLSRVHSAIRDLVDSPQNNLRAFYNGRSVLLDELDKYCPTFLHAASEDVEEDRSPRRLKDVMLDALARVLCKEDVLAGLQMLQALDVPLDVEGCEAIFEHLVALCGGSESTALEAVAALEVQPLPAGFVHVARERTGLQNADPSSAPSLPSGAHGAVGKYMELWSIAKAALVDADTRRKAALRWVRSLTSTQCCWMLHLWRVALGAKDASVMVRFVDTDFTINRGIGGDPPLVRLVDLGPKPLTKIAERIGKEAEICASARSIMLKSHAEEEGVEQGVSSPTECGSGNVVD